MFEAAVWAIAATPFAAEWGRRFWFADLFNHFRIQLGGLALLAALVCAARSEWGLALLPLPAAVFCAVTARRSTVGAGDVGPRPASGSARAASEVGVLTCNVWLLNRNYDRLSRLIVERDPDVVVLLETDHGWFGALREALSHYQHHKAELRDDCFGVAVFSRHAMTATVEYLHPEAKPSIRCRVRHPSGDLTLWAMHPEPPYLWDSARRHGRELEEVASRVRGEGLPAVIAGDLNTAPWARSFREHLSGFDDASAGRGWGTTWPAPLPPPLRIPIDHVLHTSDFVTAGYEVLPDVGSDHRPILARLARRDPPSATSVS